MFRWFGYVGRIIERRLTIQIYKASVIELVKADQGELALTKLRPKRRATSRGSLTDEHVSKH